VGGGGGGGGGEAGGGGGFGGEAAGQAEGGRGGPISCGGTTLIDLMKLDVSGRDGDRYQRPHARTALDVLMLRREAAALGRDGPYGRRCDHPVVDAISVTRSPVARRKRATRKWGALEANVLQRTRCTY